MHAATLLGMAVPDLVPAVVSVAAPVAAPALVRSWASAPARTTVLGHNDLKFVCHAVSIAAHSALSWATVGAAPEYCRWKMLLNGEELTVPATRTRTIAAASGRAGIGGDSLAPRNAAWNS